MTSTNSYPTPCLPVLLAGALLTVGASAETPSAFDHPHPEDEHVEARREFARIAFDYLRGPGEEDVPLRRLGECFHLMSSDPRRLRTLMAYDPNEDQRVTLDEIYGGLTQSVYFQMDRNMMVDVDDDGRLTLTEFSLQTPDDGTRPDTDGSAQERREKLSARYFNRYDTNGDDFVSPGEIIGFFTGIYIKQAGAHLYAERTLSADRDGNGTLELEEFAALHGAPVEDVKRAYDRWDRGEPGIGHEDLEGRFAIMDVDEYEEFTRLVRQYWETNHE